VTYVDVFAARPAEGNLLAVVHDANDMSTDAMRVIAQRLRLSEISFVQSAPGGDADYRHRIFTVGGEIPFAGHPSLGCAAAVAHQARLGAAVYRQLTQAGIHAIEVELGATGVGRASMRQSEPEFGVTIPAAEALQAAGLGAKGVHRTLPVQLVSTGFPTLIVPLASVRVLEKIDMVWDRLDQLLVGLGPVTPNYYAVAEVEVGRWRARCFARDMSGGEDPATGSAAGPLAAYLARHADTPRIVVDQGIEMGMPSLLYADASDGVVVSGPLFIAGEGELWTPY
jgi:trans-2,3-dihydro-3-hydroxyanthranilate isomerase